MTTPQPPREISTDNIPQLLVKHFFSIRKKNGEITVTPAAALIRAAYISIGLPAPSMQITSARREALAYHTADMDDAIDTALAMSEDFDKNPTKLIAQRDIPTDQPLYLFPNQRINFNQLLTIAAQLGIN